MRAILLGLSLLALSLSWVGVSFADEVRLKNGRLLRGQILRQNARQVVIRSARGTLTIPRAAIAEVVSGLAPRAALRERRAALAEDDAEGRADLATWAAANGLGREALELQEEARALILVRRMERAEAEGTARAFVGVFHWGRRAGVARETLIGLLATARGCDPKDPELISAARSYRRQLAAEEKRLREAAAALRRPRYLDPEARHRGHALSTTWRPPGAQTSLSADELDAERTRVSAAKAALTGYARDREGSR